MVHHVERGPRREAGETLDRFANGRYREVVTIGVVGTFATGWLIERLNVFDRAHPEIDLRVLTNNNRVDLAGEGLDMAVKFGDGAWHGAHAEPIMAAPLTPLCSPGVAARLTTPMALSQETLLRSYRADEWPRWFEAANTPCPRLRGPVFDSSLASAVAATAGLGVVLAPAPMFARELASERLMRPFPQEIDAGRYWLIRLQSRRDTPAMDVFRKWIIQTATQS